MQKLSWASTVTVSSVSPLNFSIYFFNFCFGWRLLNVSSWKRTILGLRYRVCLFSFHPLHIYKWLFRACSVFIFSLACLTFRWTTKYSFSHLSTFRIFLSSNKLHHLVIPMFIFVVYFFFNSLCNVILTVMQTSLSSSLSLQLFCQFTSVVLYHIHSELWEKHVLWVVDFF